MRAFLLFLLTLLAASPAAAQLGGGERHVDVRLTGGVQGTKGTVAIVMRPQPGWHGYWLNPGDAGQPTTAEWRLPQGAVAGPLRYPVPDRLLIGGLMNYVFARDYALIAGLTLARPLAPGATLPVGASLRYLACTDKLCVPESAEVSAVLGAGIPAEVAAFEQALPRPLGTPARFARAGGQLRLGIPLPAAVKVAQPYFYPATDGAVDYAAPQRVSRNGDWLVVETKAGPAAPGAVEGVLTIAPGQGLSVAAAPGSVPPAGTPVGEAPTRTGGAGAILLALGGAMLGGLLLNVMPCVFPILSLKALSLARAGESARAARIEGLAYTAGVVLVCLALGGLLLALRAGGTAAGWAFQLQDPRVALFLLLLIGGLALNLAGLFELPSFGGGDVLAGKGGAAGAFWTGALAAFVATPCTGPFMGAALGAALVLPAAAGLAVFAGLGLGLALPFLLLGFVPALRRRLPRPGAWMNRLRRILAVPMALTALWLGWLLWREAGDRALLVGLAALAALALALWWGGKRGGWAAAPPGLAIIAAGLLLVPAAPAARAEAGALGAQPFSEARLARLRAEKRPVFVYFTADWCLTCKVNEKAVLERAEVGDAFRKRNVAVLVGDWTRGNPEIGRFLEDQGRSGVPLYLWYPPGGDPRVLPQILTVGAVTTLAS